MLNGLLTISGTEQKWKMMLKCSFFLFCFKEQLSLIINMQDFVLFLKYLNSLRNVIQEPVKSW